MRPGDYPVEKQIPISLFFVYYSERYSCHVVCELKRRTEFFAQSERNIDCITFDSLANLVRLAGGLLSLWS